MLPRVLTTVVVILLILLLVAELGLRWFVGRELRTQFADQATAQGLSVREDPTISFGATPLLLGLATGTVGQVTVDTPETVQITYPGGAGTAPEILGTPQAQIILEGLGIRDTENPVAETMVVSTFLPDELLLATIEQELAASNQGQARDLAGLLVQQLVQVTAIVSDPATQSVAVEFSDGAARMQLHPTAVDGQLSLEITDSQLFGFGLPGDISRAITEGMSESVASVGGDLQLDRVEVVEGGVQVDLRGHNVNLRDLGAAV